LSVLIKISTLFVLLLLIVFGLDKLFYFGLLNNKNLKSSYVFQHSINSKVLIHGPCEPLWMVDPGILDSVAKINSYNLALSHSDFADNFLHLHLYLKKNIPPEILLLYVTPESIDKRFNAFNTYRFIPFLSDDTVKEVIKEMDSQFYNYSFIPFIRYAYFNKQITFQAMQGLKHFITKKEKPYFENGFEPPAKITWDNHLEDMQKQYPEGFEFKIDTLRIKYLKKIISLAKSKNIKTILYESPVLNESLEHLKNRNEIILQLQKIADESQTEFILFKNDYLSSSRKFYISSLNLNEKGLRIFNDSLAKFLDKEIKKNAVSKTKF
jgi:hypothetical protein